MTYLRKLLSLEEMATSQVAINLCQDDSFKEVALCLEKPSICGFDLWSSPYSNNFKKVREWDAAIDEQYQKLTKLLPQSLKHGMYIWITRIALEYSSYSRRMELLFGVSRYYCMNNLTREDWIENCRLNEMKLAKKLLKDERLTILQRYRIACTYCLHVNIPQLWNELTHKEKQSITGKDDPCYSQEKNPFVLLWSYYLDGCRDEKITGQKNHLWIFATLLAVHYGNRDILMQCWKRLNKHSQKLIVINRALQSLKKWKRIQTKNKWRIKLVFNDYRKPCKQSEPIERFNLPSYYSELLRFFLSKMSERQQLKFFEIVFHDGRICDFDNPGFSVLRCFTEWPLQDFFLPTMKRLWGIIPKELYGQLLLLLAGMNRGDYDRYSPSGMFDKRENLYYDYRNVLWNLWEDTPEVYKQHVFCYMKPEHWGSNRTVIEYLLRELVKREPLEDRDTELFKRVFDDIPEEKKIELIHSGTGKIIFYHLMYEGKWSFIDWFLKECLPNVEIPSFKKPFIKSHDSYCFIKLEENCEKYVNDFIDWAFELDTTKMQFKYEILKCGTNCIATYLCEEKFAEVERMINFCLSSEEMKMQFKYDILKEGDNSIANCLSEGKFAGVERIINFCLSSDEMKMQFKYEILKKGTNSIVTYLSERNFAEVERMINFCLSSEEMKMQFKCEILKEGANSIASCLSEGKFVEAECVINFCLSSEEMKRQFKVDIVKKICHSLLKNCAWDQMDKILSWGFDAEEKIKDFKKDLFCCDGIDIHYSLVFIQRQWENVECFYKWFCLSPEEIINIKKTTLFSPEVFEHILQVLYREKNAIVTSLQKCYSNSQRKDIVQHKDAIAAIIVSLRWCLTDEEMVFTLKEEVERQYFIKKNLNKKTKIAKKQLDNLVNELLCDLKKEMVYNKICDEGTSMKDKGQKRSLVMEDESNLPRKQFHQCVQE